MSSSKNGTTKAALVVVVSMLLLAVSGVEASVFLPRTSSSLSSPTPFSSRPFLSNRKQVVDFRLALRRAKLAHKKNALSRSDIAAMAIPGYGVAEEVFVGGFANFLGIYNFLITARILLSWFPQAQGVGALQPLFSVTDPFLNLFRGVIPPVFGLDLSPIAAFFLLNLLTNATAAVGCEIPDEVRKQLENGNRSSFQQRPQPQPQPHPAAATPTGATANVRRGRRGLFRPSEGQSRLVSLNY